MLALLHRRLPNPLLLLPMEQGNRVAKILHLRKPLGLVRWHWDMSRKEKELCSCHPVALKDG